MKSCCWNGYARSSWKNPPPKQRKNSSKPSSQTDKDETALGQFGSKAKGKKERRQPVYNARTIETTKVATVSTCDICGEDLTETAWHQFKRGTKINIIFEKAAEQMGAQVMDYPPTAPQSKARCLPNVLQGYF